jgi:multidrug efflux system membrane fusion protein
MSTISSHLARVLPRALTVSIVLILAACAGADGSVATAPPPPAVNVAAVVEKNVIPWDTFSGRIEAVDRVEIRPRVDGYLERVAFAEGSEVKKGDVLFEIDAREYRATHERALADAERAKARVSLARSQLERAQRLLVNNAISRNDVDTRVAEAAQAQADLRSAQAAVEQTRLNLGFTRVTAPIAGRVGKALVTPGNLVSGGAAGATVLTTLVSLDPIYVTFEGDEQTFLRYQQQARSGERAINADARTPVRFGLASESGYPHTGTLNFLDNEIDSGAGTIRARALVDNRERRFTPGLFARVQLVGGDAFAATLINDRAVLTDQDRKYVYVLGADNKALRRDVRLGAEIDGLRVVSEGLKSGDVVLVNGLQKVFFAGMPVVPNTVPMDKPEQAPAAAASTVMGVR